MSRVSRAEWAKRVDRWKDSGLSAKAFASETGLKATSLTFWSWKLRRDEAAGRAKPVLTAGRGRRSEANAPSVPARRFVEVSAEISTHAASMIELVLNHGIHVRVPSGFDEATLTRLVRAVEAAR